MCPGASPRASPSATMRSHCTAEKRRATTDVAATQLLPAGGCVCAAASRKYAHSQASASSGRGCSNRSTSGGLHAHDADRAVGHLLLESQQPVAIVRIDLAGGEELVGIVEKRLCAPHQLVGIAFRPDEVRVEHLDADVRVLQRGRVHGAAEL